METFNPPEMIVHIQIHSYTTSEVALQEWLEDKSFNEIGKICMGAKAMIMKNIDLGIGTTNGAMCKIKSINTTSRGEINGIAVVVDTTVAMLTIRCLKHKRKAINGKWFHKSTFPLTLAYTITGHKSQGATTSNKALLIFRGVFTPSLTYVMLSRVTERTMLRILHSPHPDIQTNSTRVLITNNASTHMKVITTRE